MNNKDDQTPPCECPMCQSMTDALLPKAPAPIVQSGQRAGRATILRSILEDAKLGGMPSAMQDTIIALRERLGVNPEAQMAQDEERKMLEDPQFTEAYTPRRVTGVTRMRYPQIQNLPVATDAAKRLIAAYRSHRANEAERDARPVEGFHSGGLASGADWLGVMGEAPGILSRGESHPALADIERYDLGKPGGDTTVVVIIGDHPSFPIQGLMSGHVSGLSRLALGLAVGLIGMPRREDPEREEEFRVVKPRPGGLFGLFDFARGNVFENDFPYAIAEDDDNREIVEPWKAKKANRLNAIPAQKTGPSTSPSHRLLDLLDRAKKS